MSNVAPTLIHDLLNDAAAHADSTNSNDAHIESLQEMMIAAWEILTPDQRQALASSEIGIKGRLRTIATKAASRPRRVTSTGSVAWV